MMRRAEVALAYIALLEGDLDLAGRLLKDSGALGLMALHQLCTRKHAAALCCAWSAQAQAAVAGGRKMRESALWELHASTWVLLQLLQLLRPLTLPQK